MKKNLFIILILISIHTLTTAQNYSPGDTNHSGKIDILDALLTAQYYVNLNPPHFDASLADVDGSSGINVIDALLIAQYYVGLITRFPTEQKICPAAGRITYYLNRESSPTQEQLTAYNLISEAMDRALTYYNCYTNIRKSLSVSYVPSVATADANSNGSIRFGNRTYMNYITAMHEVSHTVGIGTHSRWSSLISNGIFTGTNATNQLRAITGNSRDQLHADSQHFWPYGLNYTSEVTGEDDLINHCRIVAAIRSDLGL